MGLQTGEQCVVSHGCEYEAKHDDCTQYSMVSHHVTVTLGNAIKHAKTAIDAVYLSYVHPFYAAPVCSSPMQRPPVSPLLPVCMCALLSIFS